MRVLPPRKKNWKPGSYQVGLFIRVPDGSVIELSVDDAGADEMAPMAQAALALLKKLSEPRKPGCLKPISSREGR